MIECQECEYVMDHWPEERWPEICPMCGIQMKYLHKEGINDNPFVAIKEYRQNRDCSLAQAKADVEKLLGKTIHEWVDEQPRE